MQVTSVVVTLCHLVTVDPARTPINACIEHVLVHEGFGMSDNQCNFLQPAIADWKGKSRYADDEYQVFGWKCVPGRYDPKDET